MSVLPVLLFAAAGLLVGGVITLARQGTSKVAIGLVAVLAAVAVVAGVAWLIPGDG